MDDSVLLAVDFDFNSWGNRFSPSEGDRTVGVAVSKYLHAAHRNVPWVLEGGSISSNGLGDALVSAESVLHVNRNGPTAAEYAESVLQDNLGIERVTWVPHGLLEDLKNTDGHVDNVAVFCDARTVLMQVVDRANPNWRRLRENVDVVRGLRPELDIVECDRLPYELIAEGEEQPVPYLNFVLTNSSVILPSVGSSDDGWAGGLFRDLFPDREIRFTPSATLTFGGGGPHCISMQVPA